MNGYNKGYILPSKNAFLYFQSRFKRFYPVAAGLMEILPPVFVAPSTGRMALYGQNLFKNLSFRTIASDLEVLPSKICADLVTHLLVTKVGFTGM